MANKFDLIWFDLLQIAHVKAKAMSAQVTTMASRTFHMSRQYERGWKITPRSITCTLTHNAVTAALWLHVYFTLVYYICLQFGIIAHNPPLWLVICLHCTALSPYVYPGLFNSASSSSFSVFALLAIFVVFYVGYITLFYIRQPAWWPSGFLVDLVLCAVLFVTCFTEIKYHHHHHDQPPKRFYGFTELTALLH